jgi:hypothetical protein
MSLAEKNTVQARKVIASAGPYLDSLASIAEQIKLPDTARLIREQRALLDHDTFRLIVLGRFRNGKSTFLNALLCELTHPVAELGAGAPLPVKDLPTTAALTTIEYAATPKVIVHKRDGRTEDWSLSRFRVEGTIRRNPEENARVFKDIVRFHLVFPSRTLQSGITLLDSPGTDDIRERTEIVEQAVHRCDAAIVLLRSDALAGEDERAFIQSVRACGLTELFFVVNRRDGRPVDSELKEEAWNRIVAMASGGPWYTGQDPGERRICFIDAKAALEGRLRGDDRQVAASGLDIFERRLGEFLERERRPAHIRRFVQAADAHARGVDESLQKLLPTIKAKTEEFRLKYQQLEPELKEIHRSKDRLPRIVERYRERAAAALETSFRRLINELSRDLPAEIAKAKIPSIDDAGVIDAAILPFRQKTITKEVAEAAKAVYDRRLAEWRDNPPSRPGAQQALSRLSEELNLEIQDEVRQLKRRFDRVQFELTGFQPDLASVEEAREGWVMRVMTGAATIVFPDYGYSMVAAGWSGLMRGVFVHISAASLVLTLGGPIGWAILAGVIANTVVTAMTAPGQLSEKIRGKVCDALIPVFRGLPDQVRPQIAAKLRESFSKVEYGISQAVQREIAKEEQTLRQQLEMHARSAEEKQKLLTALEHCRAEVARCRKGLQDTLIAVEAGRL